jgi:hypothetical protein
MNVTLYHLYWCPQHGEALYLRRKDLAQIPEKFPSALLTSKLSGRCIKTAASAWSAGTLVAAISALAGLDDCPMTAPRAQVALALGLGRPSIWEGSCAR